MSGSDYGSVRLGVGVRVPSGAQKIKAVTGVNAVCGLDSFPASAAIFRIVELGAPMVLLCFRGGSCRPVLTSAFVCRWVWIMIGSGWWQCPLWVVPCTSLERASATVETDRRR